MHLPHSQIESNDRHSRTATHSVMCVLARCQQIR